MNYIFNAYTRFSIVYIDDVLLFSNSIKKHFQHLIIFQKLVRENGLDISTSKIKFFQTKIDSYDLKFIKVQLNIFKEQLNLLTNFLMN